MLRLAPATEPVHNLLPKDNAMLRKLSVLLVVLGYAALVGAAAWSSLVARSPHRHFYMAKSGAPVQCPDGVVVTKYIDGSPARLSLSVGAAGLTLVCDFAPDGTLSSEGLLDGKEMRGTWIHGGAEQLDFRTYPHTAVPASLDPFADGSVWSKGRLCSEQIECGDSGLRMEREYFENGTLRAAGFRQDGSAIGVWVLLDAQGAVTLRCVSPAWRKYMGSE